LFRKKRGFSKKLGSKNRILECIKDMGPQDLVLYIIHDCIPCERITRYLTSLGASFIIRYVEESKECDEELRTLTGSTLVPVLLNRRNGRIMLGCPVDMDEFFKEFLSVLECNNRGLYNDRD
jgi:glutaredoxin